MSDLMPEIEPLGDRALTIRLGERIDAELTRRARVVAAALRRAELAGVREVVAGYATVTVFHESAYAAVVPLLMPYLGAKPAHDQVDGVEHTIPVRYEGPDLQDVAARTGLPVSDVVERHFARDYTVYLIGFVPGFAYLGDLDPALSLPRRAEPRPRVRAGAVAIAGSQTAIYPLDTPGGWHLIGHTSVVLFDPTADPPARLAAGDRVRFVPA